LAPKPWIRIPIGIQPKMLDLDPDQMSTGYGSGTLGYPVLRSAIPDKCIHRHDRASGVRGGDG